MRIRVGRGIWMLGIGVAVMKAVSAVRSGRGADELLAEVWPWLVVMAAAGLHEAGHLIAAWGASARVRGLRVDLFGARMELSGLLSYGQEFFVAAGGPLVSLLCAAISYPLMNLWGWEGVGLFCGASLVLGLVNLLPIGTLDGGRMLHCGVAWFWGEAAATTVLKGTTAVCLGILWLLSVYGLLRAGQMLSLFVFSLCLLTRAADQWANEGESVPPAA